MKIDELVKHLENIKTDENEINEKREIAEYIAQMFSGKRRESSCYVMMKDKTIYDFDSYKNLLKSNKVSPDDAYVYVENNHLTESNSVSYFYPFLERGYFLVEVYLSKLGFDGEVESATGRKYVVDGNVVPATGLKYVAQVNHFPKVDRAVVEVANIDNVAINTNLPRMVHDLGTILSTKHIDNYWVVEGIISQFDSQKLFAGHNPYEACRILHRYYENHDTSLAKEVEAIRNAYNHIFQPYRIEYNLNNITATILHWLKTLPALFSDL